MSQTFPAVVDYSVSHPNYDDLAKQYIGAMRYLGTDSRCITQSELNLLWSKGLGVGFIQEDDTLTWHPPLEGFNRGVQQAQKANQMMDALGLPATVPIFYAVDFEPTDAQLRGPVTDWFTGISTVPGRPVRCYGAYRVGEYLTPLFKWPCFWQCVAWSYGNTSKSACLYQTLGYVLNQTCDHNNLLMTKYDMLYHPTWSAPIPQPTPIPGEKMYAEIITGSNANWLLYSFKNEANGEKVWYEKLWLKDDYEIGLYRDDFKVPVSGDAQAAVDHVPTRYGTPKPIGYTGI